MPPEKPYDPLDGLDRTLKTSEYLPLLDASDVREDLDPQIYGEFTRKGWMQQRLVMLTNY